MLFAGMYAFLLAGKVMKKAGEITNYRREKREKCVQKLSLLLRQACEILVTINCLNLYYEVKKGKGLK